MSFCEEFLTYLFHCYKLLNHLSTICFRTFCGFGLRCFHSSSSFSSKLFGKATSIASYLYLSHISHSLLAKLHFNRGLRREKRYLCWTFLRPTLKQQNLENLDFSQNATNVIEYFAQTFLKRFGLSKTCNL